MDLDQAIELAAWAHRGQKDKRGEPYILHPLRVMQHCAPDHDHMIVGVLHDTIEDTEVTKELLAERGLRQELIDSLLALTRRPGESYKDFIYRASKDRIAIKVKIKDLEDNMSKERNPPPVDEKTARRLHKYRRAHAFLYAALSGQSVLEGIGDVDAP